MDPNSGKLSIKEKVTMDTAGIYLGNIFTVETNLFLPGKGKSGSLIAWESGNKKIISNDGTVRRPEPGMGNRTVTLTATVSLDGVQEKRSFEVTVLERENPRVVTGFREVYVNTVTGVPPKLPAIVITYQDDGSFSTARIQWSSIDPSEYAAERTFQVEGTTRSTTLKAKAFIHVGKVTDGAAFKTNTASMVRQPKLKFFELSRVTLSDSLFTENRDRMADYLLSLDDNQLLYNFRTAAGLDTRNAKPMDGWDAPDCNLRGHTTGHYLSAIALAYAGSASAAFKAKIDYMVAELGKCQEAMAASGKFGYGFLSGYSEEQFDKLEQLTTYPTIWAPYYTLHKIIAGLLDCFDLSGNRQALDIAEKIGDWVYARLGRLDKSHLTEMWAMYIAGEYGGMNEVMVRLYELSGKQEHLAAALLFDNSSLFIPMSENIDTLGGLHANQHIPQIIGAIKTYGATGDEYYYHVAAYFWDIVVGSHIYSIGGTGSGEMFKPSGKIAAYITDKTAESCATYNMLKLTRDLFRYNPEPKYMDYYERALYNHIAASLDKSGSSGGSTYFMPLYPASQREYESVGNSCCHGTGMESHTRYQECIYSYSGDGTVLYVNLYIPSTLDWKEKGFIITQTGNYLAGQALSLRLEGSGRMTVKLRIPYWIDKGFSIKINGMQQNLKTTPGSYAELDRVWTDGDRIDIEMPFSFRFEPTPDDPAIGSIMYGPLVMACINDSNKYMELTPGRGGIAGLIEATDDPLTFFLNGMLLMPNYMVHCQPYHTYFSLAGN